ncbi:NEDD4-binding protein 2 [Pelomyxa schiedti]|nr:NEDD4-binding protein 2 [Pelomyxa schiedti]
MGATESAGGEGTEEIQRVVSKWRAVADEEARLRSKCFEDASAAYKRGDGARAKQLSDEGKRHGEQLKIAQAKANDEVFDVANKRFGNILSIDLHGQTVDGAVTNLKERISKLRMLHCKGTGTCHKLTVICGAGHHSERGVARVGPAIKKWLHDNSYDFTEQADGGAVFVEVPGSTEMFPSCAIL